MRIFAAATFALIGATAVVYKCIFDVNNNTTAIAEFELAIAKQQHNSRRLQQSPRPIRFYAMGDTPYSQVEKQNLPLQLAKLDSSADFIVHLGDMQDRYVVNGSMCAL